MMYNTFLVSFHWVFKYCIWLKIVNMVGESTANDFYAKIRGKNPFKKSISLTFCVVKKRKNLWDMEVLVLLLNFCILSWVLLIPHCSHVFPVTCISYVHHYIECKDIGKILNVDVFRKLLFCDSILQCLKISMYYCLLVHSIQYF